MPATEHVLQLKITLRGIKPPVWRRIQVPERYTFWDLHIAIQSAMDGWEDYHLHEFQVRHPLVRGPIRIGIPDDDGFTDEEFDALPGWGVPVTLFFTLLNRRARYLYDFGDGWQHDLLLEKILPAEPGKTYPVCLGGRRQCPPEDVGGLPGYANFVEIMRNPSHPEHREMMDWHGERFDPEAFDPRDVLFDDPERRWAYAFGEEDESTRAEDFVEPSRRRRMKRAWPADRLN